MNLERFAKGAVYRGTRRFGLNTLARRLLSSRLLVLCYHSVVSDDWPDDPYRTRVATRLSDFRRQLEVVSRTFKPISAHDVLRHVESARSLPRYSVLVTFDDGFRNNLTLAAVELEKAGVPALINVTTGHVGSHQLLWTQELDERVIRWTHNSLPMPQGLPDRKVPQQITERWELADSLRSLCKRLPQSDRMTYLNRLRQDPLQLEESLQRDLFSFLNWDEVRDLDRRGFAIGSHTVTHPILTTLSPNDLEFELVASKSHIEDNLSKACPWFTYPNGGRHDFSVDVVSAVDKAGYSMAFSLLGGSHLVGANPFAIDRVCVPGNISWDVFHALLNGVLTFLHSLTS